MINFNAPNLTDIYTHEVDETDGRNKSWTIISRNERSATVNDRTTASERLHRDKAKLAQRMADFDEGCIVAGRFVGLNKNRAGHVFLKIKQDLGELQCR